MENKYIETKFQIKKRYNVYYDDYKNNAEERLIVKVVKRFDQKGREIALTSYGENGEVARIGKKFYNQNGQEIKNSSYDVDNGSLTHTIFTYNEFGQILEKKYVGAEENCFSKEVHKYDNLGNRLRFRRYRNDEVIFEIVTNYDIRGREMENIIFENGTELRSSNIILYDNANRVMENIHYDRNEDLTFREVHFYNELEELIKTVCYDSLGKIISEFLYEYNVFGGQINQVIDYDGNEKYVTFYDDNENQYEYKNYQPIGVLKNKVEIDYDEKGREIEKRYFFFEYEDGETCKYLSNRTTYEYIDKR